MIKHIALTIFTLLLLTHSPASAKDDSGTVPIPTDEEIMALQDTSTVVSVNGRDIPKWMFDNALRDTLALAKKEGNTSFDIAEKKRTILHNLVDMELLYQESERRGMTINFAGGMIRSKIISRRYENKDDFLRALAGAGMTEKQFAEIWKQQASVNELVNHGILNTIAVSEEELKARYEQDKHKYPRKPKIRASHILIAVEEDATPEDREASRQKAESVRKQVLDGKDFAELAKETGGFPSAKRGGDLGWFERTRMVPAFSEAAFALETGGISEVVETKFGFHVITKTGEKGPVADIEEIGGQLSNVIRQEKGRDAFLALKDDLLKQAEVIFHDPEMEEAYGAQ